MSIGDEGSRTRRDFGRARGGDGVGVAVRSSGKLAGKRPRVRVRIQPLAVVVVATVVDREGRNITMFTSNPGTFIATIGRAKVPSRQLYAVFFLFLPFCAIFSFLVFHLRLRRT